jgi:AcrR family transcriptional regulator
VSNIGLVAARKRAGRRRLQAPADRGARERILQAALEVFGAQGFDGARTRDIAEASGANLGLLQYYFGGKEKLWRAAVDHVFGRLWAALEGAAAPDLGDPAALETLVRTAVRFAAENPALIRLMNDEGKRDGPRLRWLIERHGRRLFDTTTALLARARTHGRLGDTAPVHLYFLFMGAAGLIFSQAAECRRLVGVDPTASPAMAEAHADALVRLLLAH